MLSEDQIRSALKEVKYPGFSRDIVSFGLIKGISFKDGKVRVRLEVTTGDQRIPAELDVGVRQAVQQLEGVSEVAVDIKVNEPVKAAMQSGGGLTGENTIPGIKHIVAVASGKGGVGKSTVTSNLAVAAAKAGLKVGLLDCDLYGPSMGLMFGIKDRPSVTEDERLEPHTKEGVRLMSMGFLVDDDSPVILRGPMVTRYTQQFLNQVNWGHLDILFLDLPPGTGDIQLTIVQTVALSGAVVVTTPQEVALIDARKAIKMFAKVNVPILGLVENMSYFVCPNDGNQYSIFGEGGGEREAQREKVELLAKVPLEMDVRSAGDTGKPAVASHPESAGAHAFIEAAEKLGKILNLRIKK
ncbi:MAG: Mrp/NBP35 family ATP-binding protein [Verrucomicrobiota bacterium]